MFYATVKNQLHLSIIPQQFESGLINARNGIYNKHQHLDFENFQVQGR